MKLQDLPMGARFEYQGLVFVKTGPLTASAEQGGQRVIPRSATIRPLDVQPAEASRKGGQVDRTAVLAAFRTFAATCGGLVDDSDRQRFEAACQEFMRALK